MFGPKTSLTILASGLVALISVAPASAVDVLVTGNANISALVIVDNTVLIWTGNHTVTVDATTTKTLAGVNAGGFAAVIDFGAADRKVILGNSAGNVVFQTGGGAGDISVTGAGTGAQTAGFLVPASTSGEIVEVRATIDNADNANHWIIGNNTLMFNDASAQVGTVSIGSDGGVAKIDVDQNATARTITPSGDFTIDLALNRTLTVTNALAVGANTLTLLGAGSTSTLAATAGVNLDNAASLLSVSGTATLSLLDLAASAGLTLLDGAALTITTAVSLGANTLTVTGMTGTAAETITATGGFTVDNAASQLRIMGDTANTIVISRVDVDGADLTTGKIDVDESVTITALTINQNATLDIASGKTLGGTATLGVAKTVTLNNTGIVTALTTATAAGTVRFTGQGTITTLTNSVAGTIVDVDENAAITNLAANQNTTVDVASGKTLTATATVSAGKILTAIGAGTISTVTLNGNAAELNATTASGIISTLNVSADGGVVDTNVNVTINTCNMTAGAGDLTVENGAVTITSANGFSTNNNTLLISEAAGILTLVKLDAGSGALDIDATTTVSTLSVLAGTSVDVAGGVTLTTAATVSPGQTLTRLGTGTMSTVNLNGSAAELAMTTPSTVTAVNVTAAGGIVDVDDTCTITAISMSPGVGDLTLDVATGTTLTTIVDVNDNQLTLAGTGVPGSINMDTDDGSLLVNANSAPGAVEVFGDVTINVATSKTLSTTVDIRSNALTLTGPGTMTRIEADDGTVTNNGGTTINDLRFTLAAGETFTYGGSVASTVATVANSSLGANTVFHKTGTGRLTLTAGGNTLFGKASGVVLDIDGGEVVIGAAGTNDNVTFDQDGDAVTVADGATLTTFGSLTVSTAGSRANVDAAPGSIVNLRSAGGAESLAAAADNDFKLLGDVNIDGDNGDYTLAGAFVFQFGDLNINSTGSLIAETPSASLLFAPDSRIDLSGAATLRIDGGASDTPIELGTTGGSDAFTLDRGSSDNVSLAFVTVSRSTYTSDDGGAAIDELDLDTVVDGGNNTNWFTPAPVDNDNDNGNDNGNTNDNDNDNDNENGNDNGNDNDNNGEQPETFTASDTTDAAGNASAEVTSPNTGAAVRVDVSGALGGSIIVTLADGNLRGDFAGIPGQAALPVTFRITDNLSGDFVAIVRLCYTDDLLTDAGVAQDELVLYIFDEVDALWVLAGTEERYLGDVAPTDIVGDYGFESPEQCIWVVRDSLGDFAAGVGPTDMPPDDNGNDNDNGGQPPRPPICGIFGMIPMTLTFLGLVELKRRSRRAPPSEPRP